jgi:hypothetical protein
MIFHIFIVNSGPYHVDITWLTGGEPEFLIFRLKTVRHLRQASKMASKLLRMNNMTCRIDRATTVRQLATNFGPLGKRASKINMSVSDSHSTRRPYSLWCKGKQFQGRGGGLTIAPHFLDKPCRINDLAEQVLRLIP